MAKRKTFYVPAGIFEGGHSAYAVAVYAYLCFCADRQGVCFPGMDSIASHAGMSRSTVKRALTELEQSGLIRSETTSQRMKNGKHRQSTNRYRLTDVPVKTNPDPRFPVNPSPHSEGTPPPVQTEPLPRFPVNPSPHSEGTAPRFPVNREINNNSKDIMGDVPSVGINAQSDTTGLDEILEPLYLDTFFDQVFAQSVKQAIKTMYRMPSLSVGGMKIGNDAIRARLSMLTIDHIDYVEKQIDNYAGDVTNGERYLMACIYNAPVDCMVKNARDGFG